MASEASRPGLVRAISRFDLTAAIVNGVIGSAIFGQPGIIAGLTGAWSPLAYVFAALGMLMVVLCFAEVASRYSEGGGAYLYCRDAFGPLVGFLAGWLLFWSRLTAYAANLNLFVDFAGVLQPLAAGPRARLVLLALVSLVLVAINVAGVRRASWTINLFTVAKLTPLVLLIVLGLPRISGEVLATQVVAQYHWTEAILLLVFAYGGFEAPLIPAAEAKNPKRDTAPALLIGIGIVAAVYVLVQLVVVGVLPEAARSKTAVADTFRLLIGPAGATLIAVGAMLSTYGYSAGATLQAPRLLLALAERRELPSPLVHLHPRFRTPDVSIVAFALLGFGLSAFGSFAANATFSAIVRLAIFALTCMALVVFRRRFEEEPSFRVPAGPVVAALGVAFSVWLLTTRTFDQAGLLVGLCAAGFLLRALTRRGAPA
jgi:APA family basic amino acid/polyamine antiporter